MDPASKVSAQGRSAVPGAEQPIAGVTEAGQNIAQPIELTVERSGEDRHVGMSLQHALDALGRGHDGKEADPSRSRSLQARPRRRRRPAGGEHRIEQVEVALYLRRGDFEVVVDRLERVVVTVKPDMTDPGRRDQL